MYNPSLIDLVAKGGYVIFILVICSLLSVKVIIEKLITFKGITEKVISDFMHNIYRSLKANDLNDALYVCKSSTWNWWFLKVKCPLTNVVAYIIEQSKESKEELEQMAYTQLDKEIAKMEKGLGILATLGSISPFIGLFGTVVGIIKSFNALSVQDSSNYTMVMSGIADALIATAAGLLVAVPAVMFYNYFMKRLKLSMPLYDEAIQKTLRYIKMLK
ncbi:MAG TPA: MotA/TolQ/ExbB proton channel family protein [Ignavibacteriaceae bacterium]|nr:MotA/TolQ/ExbB proton channel family protein [Ignavibacteriaceae bacterium]